MALDNLLLSRKKRENDSRQSNSMTLDVLLPFSIPLENRGMRAEMRAMASAGQFKMEMAEEVGKAPE